MLTSGQRWLSDHQDREGLGHRTGWHSREAILSAHAANSVMILDEVDKAGEMRSESGRSTNLTAALLLLLNGARRNGLNARWTGFFTAGGSVTMGLSG